MRKLMFAAAGAVALTVTSLAVAHGIEGPKSAKAIAGTFTATSASTTTRTCTTSDGKTIAVTNGRYSGAATGDADLTGPITLTAHSVINTTDGVGALEGKLRIDVASGEDTVAHYAAVYDHGNVGGLAAGHVHDPRAKLLANLSAGFAAATGFTNGKLGASAGGGAVELGPGRCEPTKAAAEKSEARGTVSALSSTSITVAGLTCSIPSNLSAEVSSKVKLGDRVEIRCAFTNGANTLVKVEKKR